MTSAWDFRSFRYLLVICAGTLFSTACQSAGDKLVAPTAVASPTVGAQRETGILGEWWGNERSAGGIGNYIVFLAGDRVAVMFGAILDGTYRTEDNKLTRMIGKETSIQCEFQVSAEWLDIKCPQGGLSMSSWSQHRPTQKLKRIEDSKSGTLVDKWTYRHETGALAMEEYTANGRWYMMVRFNLKQGYYSVSGDVVTMTWTDKKEPPVSATFTVTADTLTMTDPKTKKTSTYTRRGSVPPAEPSAPATSPPDPKDELKSLESCLQTKEGCSLTAFQDLAKATFDAGDLEKANTYANKLLNQAESSKKNWEYGNAIHHGNLVLGRIALKKGDVAKAKVRLLAAGRTPGSPQLDSFGPNMMLAKELLQKGEREAVLEYFQLCGKFWKGEELTDWAKIVRQGQVPDFGPHLVY